MATIRRAATSDSEWETTPSWCELCSEPVNSWFAHSGKRDHMCLETMLHIVAARPRLWSSSAVLEGIDLFASHYTKRPRGQPRVPSPTVQRLLREGLHVPSPYDPLNIFMDAFDRGDPHARREELHLLLLYLKEHNVLCLTPDTIFAAAQQGHFAMHAEVPLLLANTFPASETRFLAAMLQMITCAQTLVTMYEMCGLERLVPASLLEHRGLRQDVLTSVSGTAVGTDAASTAQDGTAEAAASGDEDDADGAELGDSFGAANSLRQAVPRAVLGSVRWALDPSSMCPPPVVFLDTKRKAYITTIAARAARLFISEMAFCRITEYVFRVEALLRTEFGAQWLRNYNISQRLSSGVSGRGGAHRHAAAFSAPPPLSNAGTMAVSDGGLDATALGGSSAFDYGVRVQDDARRVRLQTRRKMGRQMNKTPLARTVRFQ